MKRKFECWDCHKNFEADDSNWVECPHCHSDNVEYKTRHYAKYIGIAVSIVFLLVLVTIVVKYLIEREESKPETTKVEIEDSLIIGNDTITETDYTGDQEPMLSMATNIPEFNEDGYSFEITVKYPPHQEFKLQLVDAFKDDKVIAESDDGKFEDIPYSENEGGSYRVVLVSTDGKNKLSAYTPIAGFIKQVKVSKKMEISKLQSLFDAKDPSLMGVGENDYLSPELKLHFKGLPKDEPNIPTVPAEVIEKIEMGNWNSAKIINVNYDDMNRVSEITFSVKPNNEF